MIQIINPAWRICCPGNMPEDLEDGIIEWKYYYGENMARRTSKTRMVGVEKDGRVIYEIERIELRSGRFDWMVSNCYINGGFNPEWYLILPEIPV